MRVEFIFSRPPRQLSSNFIFNKFLFFKIVKVIFFTCLSPSLPGEKVSKFRVISYQSSS